MGEKLMKAGLDNGQGDYLVQKVPFPKRFKNSALIKVIQSGICGSDIHLTTERNESQILPSGHEVAGEIIEIGNNNKNLVPGDRVAVEMIGAGRACLNCIYCKNGQMRHCIHRIEDTGGGFGEYITRLPSGLFKLPDSLDWTNGALVEPMAVSVHALRYSQMQKGDIVGVVGSSTIGLSSIVVAKTFGAKKVIASARYPQQVEAAKKMGADVVVSSKSGEFEDACFDASGGIGADIVVESIGGHQSETFHQSIRATKSQGKMVYLGGMKIPMELDLIDASLREIRIESVMCYSESNGIHDYEIAIDLLDSNRFPYKDIVTHRFNLENIQKGFDIASDKKSGSIKVHITM